MSRAIRRVPGRVPRWLARGLLVGTTNMRRQFRKTREHRWIATFQVLAVVFGVFVAVGRLPVAGGDAVWPVPGGFVYGRRLAAGDPGVLEAIRGFSGVAFVLLVLLTVLKETTDGAMETHLDSQLLSAGATSVAVGNVVWNLLLTGWQFGLIVLAGASAFGVGANSPAVAATLVLAGAALLVTAVPLGYLLSLCANAVFDRVPAVRRPKVLFGAPLAVGYFLLFARARTAMSLLGSLPTGWYADLGLLPSGVGVPARGAVVAVVAPVALVGATALSTRLGAIVWYGDPVRRDHEGTTAGTTGREPLLGRAFGRPTAAVARSVWKRLRREPRTLLFAAFPVALAGSVGVELVGRRPATLPAVVAIYGAAVFGMGATLNPLGSLGTGLSVALTAPEGGRHVVRGYVLSAVFPGVPVVVGLACAAAVSIGSSPAVVAAAVVHAAVLAAVVPVVSLSIGLVLPNLEGLRPTGTGLRPPRLAATTVLLVAVAVLGLPALVGIGLGGRVAAGAGSGPAAVLVVSLLWSLAVAAPVAGLSYWWSVRTVSRYRIE